MTRTFTRIHPDNDLALHIHAMETAGWSVRQVVPLPSTIGDVTMNTGALVVYEAESAIEHARLMEHTDMTEDT